MPATNALLRVTLAAVQHGVCSCHIWRQSCQSVNHRAMKSHILCQYSQSLSIIVALRPYVDHIVNHCQSQWRWAPCCQSHKVLVNQSFNSSRPCCQTNSTLVKQCFRSVSHAVNRIESVSISNFDLRCAHHLSNMRLKRAYIF